MKYVNQPVRKTDAMSLVTGKPVYTDDLAPRDCLIVKILREVPTPTPGWKILKQVLPRRWPELHVSLLIKMCLRNVLPLPAKLHRR